MSIDLTSLKKQLPELVHTAIDEYKNSTQRQRIIKVDKSQTTCLDLRVESRLQQLLGKLYPNYQSWGEEGFENYLKENNSTIDQGSHWVIDPIDGTTNLIHNIPAYCTTLSLVQEGVVTAALTYDPNRKELFSAVKNEGCYLNGDKLQPISHRTEIKDCMAAIDFKRLSSELKKVIVEQQPFYSHRNFGSSAIEWCWLGANRFQVYIHGSLHLWDYAGGLLMLEELDGIATTLEGDVLQTNSLKKQSVVASQCSYLHQFWLELIERC